jgi:hypothetical protein
MKTLIFQVPYIDVSVSISELYKELFVKEKIKKIDIKK